MFGANHAIRKYQEKLPSELRRLFGGSGPYTKAQVDRLIADLGLSRRHSEYAYLMYCDDKELSAPGISPETLEKMIAKISHVSAGGVIGSVTESIFSAGDGGDGVGDGGGGGGDG